jgi:signal transduction histidine kinase
MKKKSSPSEKLSRKESKIELEEVRAKLSLYKNELQIESALQRVRSRLTIMKESQEINGLISLLFRSFRSYELMSPGSKIYYCLPDASKKTAELWMVDPDGNLKTESLQMPVEQSGTVGKSYRPGMKKEKPVTSRISGRELKKYIEFFSSFPFKKGEKAFQNLLNRSPGQLMRTDAGFSHGTVGILSFRPPVRGALKELQRCANEFGLIYARFLDLQKAEMQERETLIEAAFERVRAKSMAMHSSEQLADTAKVLFEQFDLLGKIPDRMSIGIMNEKRKVVELWVTDQSGNQLSNEFFFAIDEPTSISKIHTAWKEGKDAVIIDLTGQDLRDWLHFVKNEAGLPVDESKIRGRRVQQAAFFSHGFLLFTTHEPVTKETMKLLVRFARVFDLTYTRFLDLLKAEEQTLEAIKASSLDRVRAEIASMQTAEDLQRIIPLIWTELTTLGVPFIRCGVFIIDEDRAVEQVFLSTPEGQSLAILNLPFKSNKLTDNSVEHWRNRAVYREHWDRSDFLNWIQSMIELGQIQNRESYLGNFGVPESLDLHLVPFDQGMLYVGNSQPLSENEIELVKSLAKAFSAAYARYEDFSKLEQAKQNIETTLKELKDTQAQLIQSEKMASLGELTAGIAHEIQNPLNFVNNFSEINKELIEELSDAIKNKNLEEARSIAINIEANELKISHHGKRADGIVKGMLQHSQISTGQKELTDLNLLANEYMRLAYHGYRAKDKSFIAGLKTEFDISVGNIKIIPHDIGRVLLNIFNNAFYAVNERHSELVAGYEPIVLVSTKKRERYVEVSIRDNGNGIPERALDKIFQPFFTTKPTGRGTGLGLSLSYEIIKAHGGTIDVKSHEKGFTEFKILIPV